MLKTLLFIGMGSFTGGVLRYLISRYVQNFLTPSFPLGTLLVNILGCFAIGLFYGPQSENVSHRRILWRIHHLFNLHE